MSKKAVEGLLMEYLELKAVISDIEIELQHLEQIQALNYDGIYTSKTSSVSDAVGNIAIKRERLEIKKQNAWFRRKRIYNMLSILSDREKEIIEMYYFQECTMRDIAFKLDMNDSYLSRKKNTILTKLYAFAKKHHLIEE